MNLFLTTSVDNYTNQAFEELFRTHYKALHAYANLILKDEDSAEEVVQNMFLKFWEKRELLQVETSMKAYLYKCVYNDSLNLLKHEKVKLKYQDFTKQTADHLSDSASAKVELGELQIRLREALNVLPEQCRTIFQLSRFEELKYREIAEKLNISIKTVENQMGKALRLLRVELSDFLLLALLGMMYYQNYLN